MRTRDRQRAERKVAGEERKKKRIPIGAVRYQKYTRIIIGVTAIHL